MLTLPVGVDGGATGPHVVRMRRSIRIANPLVPAAERSRGPAFAITEFATDSPLEEAVSSEPVSENRKFPASWVNTGKFIDFGLLHPNFPSKALVGSET
jgi:hypothetical protein